MPLYDPLSKERPIQKRENWMLKKFMMLFYDILINRIPEIKIQLYMCIYFFVIVNYPETLYSHNLVRIIISV